jgi:hypothetical protein
MLLSLTLSLSHARSLPLPLSHCRSLITRAHALPSVVQVKSLKRKLTQVCILPCAAVNASHSML